jgi:hypothetical protein
VVQLARERAEQIVQEARGSAESIKRDALSYTVELLQDMEEQFEKTLLTVKNGRKFVEAEISKQVDENLSSVQGAVENFGEPAGGGSEPASAQSEE